MTAVWSVALLLLLPWLDAARSYHQPFVQLRPLLAAPNCLATDGLGESELGMLHYLTGVAGRRIYAGHSGEGEPGHMNAAAIICWCSRGWKKTAYRRRRPGGGFGAAGASMMEQVSIMRLYAYASALCRDYPLLFTV